MWTNLTVREPPEYAGFSQTTKLWRWVVSKNNLGWIISSMFTVSKHLQTSASKSTWNSQINKSGMQAFKNYNYDHDPNSHFNYVIVTAIGRDLIVFVIEKPNLWKSTGTREKCTIRCVELIIINSGKLGNWMLKLASGNFLNFFVDLKS